MINQLKDNVGKQIGVELLNGSKIFGTLLSVDEKTLRLDSDEGVANVLVASVQVVWEEQGSSLSETDMAEIVGRVRNIADKRYVCLGFNGFLCPRNYTCIPPHACNRFFCPGIFSSVFPVPLPPPPPPPPIKPCVYQFVGLAPGRSDDETEKSSKDNNEPKK